MSRLTASRAAFDLIASFEGFRTRAVQTGTGKWTLGFGHTATAREGLSVTRAEAEDLLRWDLLPIEDTLRQVALTPLTQNQFDALVSFAFNIGLENFKQSDVLKHLNQGEMVAASLAFHAWRRAYVNGRLLTIDALVRRRAAEAALFLETQGPRPAAPSPVIMPQASGQVLHEAKPLNVPPPAPHKEDAAIVGDEVQANIDTPPEASEKPPQRPPERVLAEPAYADVLKQPVVPAAQVQPPKIDPLPRAEGIDSQISAPPVIPPPTAAPIETPPAAATAPLTPFPELGPVLPKGLAPFPGLTQDSLANQGHETSGRQAGDGANTRLHATPEPIDAPDLTEQFQEVKQVFAAIDRDQLLTWILMALGAGLLGFGLFIAWKAGLLNLAAPKRNPSQSDIMAILAAASGFIILVTSAVAAWSLSRTKTAT